MSTVGQGRRDARVPPYRLLIVDDSTVVRGALARLLDAEPDLTVVATAADGQAALAKIDNARPDLILLDIEMPNMDGHQVLAELRRRDSRIPVLVFSSLTRKGALATIEALGLGAADYITKPSQVAGSRISLAQARHEVLTRIRALMGADPNAHRARPRTPPLPESRAATATRATTSTWQQPAAVHPVRVVAIGTSTGGPAALAQLLPELPASFPVPILIVQHMPPMFTAQLARSLDGRSAVRVLEAGDGLRALPGHAYVAPGDFHLEVGAVGPAELRLRTQRSAPVNSCRPSVDVLFASVALHYGRGALGVMMTGMGLDGLRGSRAVVEAGGHVLAQDEASSVVWSMPGAVVGAGLAGGVLPLAGLAQGIAGRVIPPAAAGGAKRT